MTTTTVEKIANAVLYEGYILYPYRASAVKNQQRWNFGAVYPEAYSNATKGVDSWTMQTECLVHSGRQTSLEVKVRFLHLVSREAGELITPASESDPNLSDFNVVPMLEVNGQYFQTWQEAIEREIEISGFELSAADPEPLQLAFSFPATHAIEPLRDEETGRIAGVLSRRQQAIAGRCEVSARRLTQDLLRVSVQIANVSPMTQARWEDREAALLRALVSTHTILNLSGGEFVSLLDPPATLAEAVAQCQNVGTYPVLVGVEGERDCMLSSPIILYDYPQIAPESAGDLYDGTEIDEILTLRIMTLTDEEKREMRSVDERARQILERTEKLSTQEMMKLHGALRYPVHTEEKKHE